jgi:hypothetical protein
VKNVVSFGTHFSTSKKQIYENARSHPHFRTRHYPTFGATRKLHFYSVNYDTRFADKPNGLGMKIGGAVMYGNDAGYFVPASLNYLIGKQKHFLEIGSGGVGIFYKNSAGNATQRVFPTATLVYRYQPIERGFLFRIGLAPVFAPQENNSYLSAKIFWLLPGVSLGYKF